MKAEDSQPPATTTFSAAQWPNQIPIDPALQQQSQSATTSAYSHYHQYGHYNAAGYTGHYQYTPQTQHQSTPTTQTLPSTSQPSQSTASLPRPVAQPIPNQMQSAVDTTDVATLNDALGSAGVDLRAEEETLQRTNDQYYAYRPYEDRSRKQPDKPQFDTTHLGNTVRAIGSRYKSLVTAMIAAAKHRTDTHFDQPPSTYEDGTPMWSIKVRSDTAKQLEALQKAYKEEDMKERRERKERQDAQAAQSGTVSASVSGGGPESAAGEDDGGPKKKKKKEGPGVTARNMSEDVRKKMSNAVASQAAGLGTGKYAWMSAANASAAPAKPKPAAAGRGGTPATTTTPASSTAGGWARPYQSSKTNSQQQQKDVDGRLPITLRDAVFVVQNEKGHGGGRGAAKAWT